MAPLFSLILCSLVVLSAAKPEGRMKRQAYGNDCSSRTYNPSLGIGTAFNSRYDCQVDHDGHYPNNANWLIRYAVPPVANFVNVAYQVDIELAVGCVYDKLVINLVDHPDLELCGQRSGAFSWYVDEFVDISFHSDYIVTAPGFNYTISFTEENEYETDISSTIDSNDEYSPDQYSSYDYSPYQYSSYDYSPDQYSSYDYNPYQYSSYDYSPYQYSSYDYSPYQYSSYDYSSADYYPYSSYDYSSADYYPYSSYEYSPYQYSSYEYSPYQYSSYEYSPYQYSSYEYSSNDYSSAHYYPYSSQEYNAYPYMGNDYSSAHYYPYSSQEYNAYPYMSNDYSSAEYYPYSSQEFNDYPYMSNDNNSAALSTVLDDFREELARLRQIVEDSQAALQAYWMTLVSYTDQAATQGNNDYYNSNYDNYNTDNYDNGNYYMFKK